MAIKILVVEDDEQIRGSVGRFLTNAGFTVDECGDGDAALELFYAASYHLVILDIMLPGVGGQKLLKEFRVVSDAPVLIITALNDDENQLAAFANEADDYVTKPFSMQILVKRAEALLRRSGVLKREICAGSLVLFPEAYRAEYGGTDIGATPREFELLLMLAQNKGRVITHETLLTRIWGYDYGGNEGIVHAHMRNLRNKIPESVITTVKGVGYRLEDDARGKGK